MRRFCILITFILINTLTGFAPVIKEFVIISPTPMYVTHNPQAVLQAMIYIESGNKGNEAYNPNEPQAVGVLQIWPIFVEDINRIVGYEKYSLNDRLDENKSIEMFWIYQKYYNPEMDTDKMCRIWCGGPDGCEQDSTLEYLHLVRTKLYNG